MKKSYAQLAKDRRELLKQQGLCINCGKQPSEINKVRCISCLELARQSNKRYQDNHPDEVKARRKDWYSNGKFGYKTRLSQKKQR